MIDERVLIEKLRKIEALHAGTTFDGERAAAQVAIDAIRQKLKELQEIEKPVEYSFKVTDIWSKRLLTALMRRYGIRPYRYKRQRRTTIMANVPKSFVDNTLWPEFVKLNDTLNEYLSDITDRIINEAIFEGDIDIDIKQDQKLIS